MLGMLQTKTSTGTNKMRKTNALYLKTQRLIAETHRDTHIETHRDTNIKKHAHRETHTHIETHAKSCSKGLTFILLHQES